MTLLSTKKKNQYTLSGVGPYSYQFLIQSADELDVFIDGVIDISAKTITGVGNPNGGTVTFDADPGSGTLTLARNLAFTQLTDYIEGDKFPAETHESALDRAAMRDLQLLDETERSVKVPTQTATFDPTLPDMDLTANHGKVLQSTASGWQLVTVKTTDFINPITSKGDLVQGDASGNAERLGVGPEGESPVVQPGGNLGYGIEDARTNTVKVAHVVKSTTTGTPAAGIGVATKWQAESVDEAPSDAGQIDFEYTDVTGGSEDTVMDILLRVAGAALTKVWRFVSTTAFKGIFSHSNSADRTYTLPNVSGNVQIGATPEGYIDGLTMSNDTDADHDISFGVGVAEVNGFLVKNSSAMVKQIDAAWAAGTAAGGLFSGTVANSTWYHCFFMRNDTTHATDFGFDTSVTGANAPAGWTVRRIGAVLTNGSANIIAFTQDGDYFQWTTLAADIAAVNPGNNAVSATISAPGGIATRAHVLAGLADLSPGTFEKYMLVSPLDGTDEVPAAGLANVVGNNPAGTDDMVASGEVHVRTNTSSQVRYRITDSQADVTVYLKTRGWYDPRGRR